MRFSLKCFSLLVLILILSVSSLAQQSMNLGELRFVMPNSNVKSSARTLHMQMSTKGISARAFSKVGGVAFIQTAEPNFVVDTLMLYVNNDKNNASVMINNRMYEIPLEVWELQSIVNYANSEENAAVTLYGDSQVKIKYHNAFIDNLMGLRILQADLNLTGFLKITDICKLPSYSDGKYVWSAKEKEYYESYCDLLSVLGSSYEYSSQCGTYKILSAMDSIGEHYDTYIYTDYNQPIKFALSDDEIEFSGRPYYRFASRDTMIVDTLEMYYTLKNFVDTINCRKRKYKNLSIAKHLKSPMFSKLEKLVKKNRNVQKKAIKAFELMNYYALCDTFEIDNWTEIFDRIGSYVLYKDVKLFSDSIIENSNNQKLVKLCREYNSIYEELDYYDYPIVTAYVNDMYSIDSSDSNMCNIYDFTKQQKLTLNKLIIQYMYDNRIPAVVVAENTTNYLKENLSDYIFMINPIVYSATTKVCQWSAFFRYVKENYSKEWECFVKRVEKLRYDAPVVITPINIEKIANVNN